MGSKFKSVFTEEYKIFLARLRAARKAAGLSQEALAERLNEYQIFMSRSERGERRVDIIELRAFCRAMGVPFVDFVKDLDTALTEMEEQSQKPAKKGRSKA